MVRNILTQPLIVQALRYLLRCILRRYLTLSECRMEEHRNEHRGHKNYSLMGESDKKIFFHKDEYH